MPDDGLTGLVGHRVNHEEGQRPRMDVFPFAVFGAFTPAVSGFSAKLPSKREVDGPVTAFHIY